MFLHESQQMAYIGTLSIHRDGAQQERTLVLLRDAPRRPMPGAIVEAVDAADARQRGRAQARPLRQGDAAVQRARAERSRTCAATRLSSGRKRGKGLRGVVIFHPSRLASQDAC